MITFNGFVQVGGPAPEMDAISVTILEILPDEITEGICSSQTEAGLDFENSEKVL